MYQLKVDNMTCGHCVSRVTQAVKTVDAAAAVAIDLPTKLVRITSSHDVGKIINAINEAGYPAQSIANSEP